MHLIDVLMQFERREKFGLQCSAAKSSENLAIHHRQERYVFVHFRGVGPIVRQLKDGIIQVDAPQSITPFGVFAPVSFLRNSLIFFTQVVCVVVILIKRAHEATVQRNVLVLVQLRVSIVIKFSAACRPPQFQLS